MSRPKILITNFHPYLGGGHDTFIKSLAGGSLQEFFEFAVAVPRTSFMYEIATEQGIPVYPCDFPSNIKEVVEIIQAIQRFKAICREYRPLIVHTNGGADNNIVAWSLLFQKKRFGIVRTHHAIRQMATDPYHQWLYRRVVNKSVYVSQTSKEINQSAGGLEIPHATVIENGVDTEVFQPQERDVGLRQRLGIAADDFVFGSCAGTSGYKRIDIMFQASRALIDAHQFKIVILGQEQDREPILGLAASMGVKNNVIYGGFHKDVRNYCSLFDVGFILSDAIETISYASREMLSMGIPLISSSYSGLRENIDDGVNGFLVRSGNAEDVTQRMLDFMGMGKDRLAEFRKQARNKAVASFSIKKQLADFYQLYLDLLPIQTRKTMRPWKNPISA